MAERVRGAEVFPTAVLVIIILNTGFLMDRSIKHSPRCSKLLINSTVMPS